MDHFFLLAHEKCRPNRRHFFKNNLLILVLALLVGDAAAGLAGRLAGGLALAAAAVLGALAQIAGLDGLNMLHGSFLLVIFSILSVYHGVREMSMRFFAFPFFRTVSISSQVFFPNNYRGCASARIDIVLYFC